MQTWKTTALICAMTLGLFACASELKVPITGDLQGRPAAGQAVARSDGHGEFWVQEPGGPRCSGSYNPRDTNPTIIVPVSCSDGRTGETVITRQMDGLSGTAVVALNDGSKGQFVFGNVRYEQAFGSGGKAATVPTIVTR